MKFKPTIGRAIKVVRAIRGMSQRDLAAKAGITKGFLSQIEAGERSPSLKSMTKIASALGTQIGVIREISKISLDADIEHAIKKASQN